MPQNCRSPLHEDEADPGLDRFFNAERLQAALVGRTPAEAYRCRQPEDMMDKLIRASLTFPQAQQEMEDQFERILAA